jgi:hypothetical protein
MSARTTFRSAMTLRSMILAWTALCSSSVLCRTLLWELIADMILWTLDDANTEKQSLDLLFLSSPKKYLQGSLKRHRLQTQLVPRFHIKIYKVK